MIAISERNHGQQFLFWVLSATGIHMNAKGATSFRCGKEAQMVDMRTGLSHVKIHHKVSEYL